MSDTMLTSDTAVVDFATEVANWLFYMYDGNDWSRERAHHPDLDFYAYRSMRIMQAAKGGRRLT